MSKLTVNFHKQDVGSMNLSQKNSLLTKIIKETSGTFSSDLALLPSVSERDPNFQRLKVYFFGTNKSMNLPISKAFKVEQIITHIIALTRLDHDLSQIFEENIPPELQDLYKNPKLYEMRLLEEEYDIEDGYKPLYETGAMANGKPIGGVVVTC